jgi:acyl-CoA thioesterase-1
MFFRLLFIFKIKKLILLVISLLSLSFVSCETQANAVYPKILVYGDSLSASYGVAKEQGWVAILQKKLNVQHYQYEVINASISGETTSGGLTRFTSTLAKTKPSIIILELGANDGLRGLPVKEMSKNLSTMISLSKEAKVRVLLIGMRIPPNYGPKYTELFSNTYPQLSQQHQIPLVPFMLENIAAHPNLIQDDGLHPNALGQPMIIDNIWPELHLLLKK